MKSKMQTLKTEPKGMTEKLFAPEVIEQPAVDRSKSWLARLCVASFMVTLLTAASNSQGAGNVQKYGWVSWGKQLVDCRDFNSPIVDVAAGDDFVVAVK